MNHGFIFIFLPRLKVDWTETRRNKSSLQNMMQFYMYVQKVRVPSRSDVSRKENVIIKALDEIFIFSTQTRDLRVETLFPCYVCGLVFFPRVFPPGLMRLRRRRFPPVPN